jgi:hypothetical protein
VVRSWGGDGGVSDLPSPGFGFGEVVVGGDDVAVDVA